MKKLLLLPTLLLLCGFMLPAQTLKIFHRSHGGSMSTFAVGDFDVFGISPEMIQQQEEAERKQQEAEKKRLEKEAKKREGEKRKQDKLDKKHEKQEGQLQREDAPISDPPSGKESRQEMPQSDATPVQNSTDTYPVRQEQGPAKQVSSIERDEPAASIEMEVAAAPSQEVTRFTPREERRQHRMEWLFGIMALTIVPTLVVASGALRRKDATV